MKTYTQFTFQVVFSSKYRRPFLHEGNEDALFSYLGGILHRMDCHPFIQGGHVNHIHLIFELSRQHAISKVVQEVKKGSNRFMKENWNRFPDFPGWQVGYGGFTYSKDARPNLINYVKNQHNHHRKITFLDEYIKLLEEHGIDYDPKYLL